MFQRASSRALGGVGAVFAALLASSPASAQDEPRGSSGAQLTPPKDPAPPPPAPAPAQITMPVIKKDEGVRYPEQALRDKVRDRVEVVVILELDAEGRVKTANVETPMGHGFDEAAIEAATKLEFDPATKNGKPVAAKIKHKYSFDVPPGKLTGAIRTESADKPLGGARVSVMLKDGSERTSTTAADGSFTIDALPAGKYSLRIVAEGYAAAQSEETIEPAEELAITLRLARPNALPPPPPVAGEDIEEVQVRGVRPPREVTRRTLNQRELSRIPGTNGDALRALQYLPGVARPPGLAGLLIIRGSAPQDTNVFIDGTLVPNVYHFGGLSSVIPTETIDKLDFYPGNFSTEYGRVTGGVVDVKMRDPGTKDGKIHGLAQVDLIDSRLLVQGPIFDTGWNFLVGGRRSYIDLWLKPALEETAGVTTAPVYYDYQVGVGRSWNKGKGDFRLLLIGSDDKLAVITRGAPPQEPGIGGSIGLHNGFWRLQGKFRQKFSEETEVKLVSAVGQDFIDFNVGSLQFNLSTTPITTRFEISQKIAPGVTSNLGLDLLYAPYKVHVRAPPLPKVGEPPGGPFSTLPPLETTDSDAQYRPGIYEEFELTPFRGTRIVPGVRLDYAKDTKKWDVSPRFVARQDLTKDFPRTTLKGGVGVFRQPPQPQETNVVFGQSGLSSARAIHYSLGFEQEIARPVELSMEGFYKQLDNLVVPQEGNSGTGYVVGAETLLRYKPVGRFFGWVAYTLSKSMRRDGPEDPLRPTPFDQTHILTVIGSYQLGRGWELGGNFRFVSGNNVTPRSYGYYDENAGANLAVQSFPVYGRRLPPFHVLSIRIDKVWKISDTARISTYLDVYNVYNHGNVEAINYNYNSTRESYQTGIPILPNIGIRGEL